MPNANRNIGVERPTLGLARHRADISADANARLVLIG
jgi:hypothetical protein